MSNGLRIGTKDRAIILVMKRAYGGTSRPTKTQVVGAAGPFSEDAKKAIATLYDWLGHAKDNPS